MGFAYNGSKIASEKTKKRAVCIRKEYFFRKLLTFFWKYGRILIEIERKGVLIL